MDPTFDDSRLEDPRALAAGERWLRPLAEAGARLRRTADAVADSLAKLAKESLPRAVIALGPQARLLRAVVEPTCPVPFVAWPRLGLPGWVGSLDTVIALGEGEAGEVVQAAAEAVRRGARLVVACPPDSVLAAASASRDTTLLPAWEDPLSTAIVVLDVLNRLGLGPSVDIPAVAQAMDDVAVESSAQLDIAQNPAKGVALELADAQPLVWGGSILAARSSRRVAEGIREAGGRMALAADAAALLPLMTRTAPRDVFADPFEQTPEHRPGLVIVDDGLGDEVAVAEDRRLAAAATAHDLRVSRLECFAGDRVQRYVTVTHQGLFAAAYLRIALEPEPMDFFDEARADWGDW